MLQNWLRKVNSKNSLEIGLAFGVSSLFILDELSIKPEAQHFGIDPMQFNDRWFGLGLENIKRAGFKKQYRFYNETSFQALPKILDQGYRFDFALIDGWHTFDYTLVDFFYIDKMLNNNGVIVFDDVGYKAIRKVVTFVLSNLEYELVDGVKFDHTSKSGFKAKLKSKMAVLSRDDWTPSEQSRAYFAQLENMQTVVVQKQADDSRLHNHFQPF